MALVVQVCFQFQEDQPRGGVIDRLFAHAATSAASTTTTHFRIAAPQLNLNPHEYRIVLFQILGRAFWLLSQRTSLFEWLSVYWNRKLI